MHFVADRVILMSRSVCWRRNDSRVGYGLDPSMNEVGLDGMTDPLFKLVIIAAQLMMFVTNYDV